MPDQKKNSASSIIAHVTVLLVLLAGAVSPVLATNMWETHGYDYEYEIESETIFPVGWDLGGAWFSFRDYAKAYLPTAIPDAYANGKIKGLLGEAYEAGMNMVIIRTEGRMDAQNMPDTLDAPTDYLSDRANMLRKRGLHVMLGGFMDILDDTEHNDDVKAVIENYITGMISPLDWGSVIGIHGFDEPDNKYDASSSQLQESIRVALSDFHNWSNEEIDPGGLSYPFGCFMAKPAIYLPNLELPHIYQDPAFNSTVFQLCKRQDFPMLDWYPCKTFPRSVTESSIQSADIHGATDLLPTPASSDHYRAYNTRDELWTIDYDESAQETVFHVYEVTGEGQMGSTDFLDVWSHDVLVTWPFETASSDYRASDIGGQAPLGAQSECCCGHVPRG